MRKYDTAAQKPVDERSGSCPICSGKGRVDAAWGHGKRKRTKKCIQCRGTGKATSGYVVK
jgi:DnaJ-class molecular chaperone